MGGQHARDVGQHARDMEQHFRDMELDAREKRRASSTSGASKSSPPNLNPKKWKKDCMALLDEINELPFSAPFRVPVSAIDFPDYHRYEHQT